MPRVFTQTKNRAGRARSCGRCGTEIKPGDSYYKFSFRYGGTHYRCSKHYPRQSELTQSKMAEIYSAIEGAEEDLVKAQSEDDVGTAVQTVADTVRDVAQEYADAAEHF